MKVNEPPRCHEDAGSTEAGWEAKTLLTFKELKVVELLSYGYENRDIASHFQTTDQAVKNMLRNINLKLGADNRTHAVAVCFRNGWLSAAVAANQSGGRTPRLRGGRIHGKPRCARRSYRDGTVDSICPECGLVIARAWRTNDLLAADRNHVCQPKERRHKVRFIVADMSADLGS